MFCLWLIFNSWLRSFIVISTIILAVYSVEWFFTFSFCHVLCSLILVMNFLLVSLQIDITIIPVYSIYLAVLFYFYLLLLLTYLISSCSCFTFGCKLYLFKIILIWCLDMTHECLHVLIIGLIQNYKNVFYHVYSTSDLIVHLCNFNFSLIFLVWYSDCAVVIIRDFCIVFASGFPTERLYLWTYTYIFITI